MIVGDHPVPDKTVNARQRVAEDRAAEMPHVHFLGDVRTAVIDHDRLGHRDRGNPKTGVAETLGNLLREVFGLEAKIEETGPGDLGLLGDVPDEDDLGQLARELDRIGPHRLAKGQREVGLEVAVPGIGTRAYIGCGRQWRKDFGSGAGDAGFDFLAGRIHR